uniref:Uncharacterized protein n=1 Tax=Rhizophora mucronata TaxID=61149 RepID=A0A2P2PX94_RHIMU
MVINYSNCTNWITFLLSLGIKSSTTFSVT